MYDPDDVNASITSNGNYIIVQVRDKKDTAYVLIINTITNKIDSALKECYLHKPIDIGNRIFTILTTGGGPSYSLFIYNYNSGEYNIIPNTNYFYISKGDKYLITLEGGTYAVRDFDNPEKIIKRFGYNTELFDERAQFIGDKYYITYGDRVIKAFKLGEHVPIKLLIAAFCSLLDGILMSFIIWKKPKKDQ